MRISGSANPVHRAVLERPMASPNWIRQPKAEIVHISDRELLDDHHIPSGEDLNSNLNNIN
jgi:hypothetical protein